MLITVLANELTSAGRHFPAGTVITPKGAPASGGYFFAMAELDGRSFLVSIRDSDIVTVEDRAEETEMLITDVNENEITEGAKVEFVGQPTIDFPGGTVGTVQDILPCGSVGVEFIGYGLDGLVYDMRPTHLALISDDEWNRAVGAGC